MLDLKKTLKKYASFVNFQHHTYEVNQRRHVEIDQKNSPLAANLRAIVFLITGAFYYDFSG